MPAPAARREKPARWVEHEWGVSCGRCGSSADWEDCPDCEDGETFPGELYEQDPLWYDEDDTLPCETCDARGGWYRCLSKADWCETHPLPEWTD